MTPLHKVTDHEKVEQLKKSIEQQGWQGAPLVKWDVYGDLLTGTHRYAAVKDLGWEDNDIPAIDIEDVFTEANMDFDGILNEYGNPYLTDPLFDCVLQSLPEDIRQKYGIEV